MDTSTNSQKDQNKIEMKKYIPSNVKWNFLVGVLFAFFAAFAEMLRPEVVARTIDTIAGIRMAEKTLNPQMIGKMLLTAALIIVVITILHQVLRYLCQIFAIRAGENFVRNIRDMLFSHILRLPASWHSSHQTGDMIQRCTMDTNEIKVFITEQLINLMTMILTIIVSLSFIFVKDYRLAIFAFISIPIIVGYSFYFHQKIGIAYLACEEEDSKLSVIAQDNLMGIRIIRAFGMERKEKDRFANQNGFSTEKWIDLDRFMCVYWVFSDVITGLTMMGFLALGSYVCVNKGLTIGNFTAAISYLIIMIQPVRQMGRVLSEMSKSEVSLRRIDEIMQVEEEEMVTLKEGQEALFHQDLSFEHVTFAYQEDHPVINDLSFTIHAGETLGILGNTGSGKSTIAELLTGMYEVENGQILLGGTNLEWIPKELLRRNVGLASREDILFSRSIRDNLMIGLLGQTTDANEKEERMLSAIEAACFDEAIAGFPEGLDTIVGERGVTLSGGQKQRAIIARTLLLDTPILILDDVLSAVDTSTDAKIRENLRKYRKGRTVIIIGHRVKSLMDADHILVLDQGHMVEYGSHEELMAYNGHYRKVYELQEGSHEQINE
ncbi:MAG: ABC transporter ATP-binding protein [Eubacteriales bacterium]|nr:ABC transporter ATP-binding protein [Eubacteriales bacterium]